MSVLIGCLGFLLCITIVLSRSDVNINSRIVGGEKAATAKYPYQVSIRKEKNGVPNQHFCGGSVITESSILTAAHCIYNINNETMTVLVGTNQLSSGGKAYTVETFIIHEKYDPETNLNDVAILYVNEPISFAPISVTVLGVTITIGTPVAKIPLSNSDPVAGSTAVLTGWGLTSYPGSVPSNDLQEIKLTIMDRSACAKNLTSVRPITIAHVCTTSTAGHGACQGDSGGPLVVNGVQVGIVSWGIPCALGYPDIFTNVKNFLPWILANQV